MLILLRLWPDYWVGLTWFKLSVKLLLKELNYVEHNWEKA